LHVKSTCLQNEAQFGYNMLVKLTLKCQAYHREVCRHFQVCIGDQPSGYHSSAAATIQQDAVFHNSSRNVWNRTQQTVGHFGDNHPS